MANIFDLANAFLSFESMTNKKLQKLCYYAKAWYLASYDTNLITEDFQAWVHGPVCPELCEKYKEYGFGQIPKNEDTSAIPEEFMGFARKVFYTYGDLTGEELEELTHQEDPWVNARGDLKPWMGSKNVIDEGDMKQFYRKKM